MDQSNGAEKAIKHHNIDNLRTDEIKDRETETQRFVTNENDTQTSIRLSDIFFIFRKRKLILFAVFIIFSVLGFGYAKITYVPAFYATSSLVVQANYHSEDENQVTPVEINLAVSLVPTYSQILKSNRVMDYVIERLDLDLPINTLRSYVSLKHVENTSILHLTVTCPDPQLAIDISNSIAEVAPKAFQETIEIGSVKVLDAAFISGIVPDSALLISLVAGFAGFFLIFALFLVFDMLFTKIKYPEDVESILGLPVLGEIEHVRKRNAKNGLLLYDSGATSKFIESNMTLSLVINHAIESKNIKKLLITGTSESEGKTLLATNLGIALAHTGKKVLLIDCDLRKPDLHERFGIAKNSVGTLFGYEDENERPKCIVEVIDGLHVLPFIEDLDRGHVFFKSSGFVEAIEDFEREYDVIIYDSAPIYDVTDTLNLVGMCDAVLLVIRQDHTSIREHRISIEKLSKVEAVLMGVVLNGIKYTPRKSKYLNKYSYRYYYIKAQAGKSGSSIIKEIPH